MSRYKGPGCAQFGCLCVYYFFLAVVVIRYETTATARRALLLIVRAFFNNTITIAVWAGFHVCLSGDAGGSASFSPDLKVIKKNWR